MKKVTLAIAVAMGLLASGISFAQDGPVEKKKDAKAEKKEVKAEKKAAKGSDRKAMKKKEKAEKKEDKADMKDMEHK